MNSQQIRFDEDLVRRYDRSGPRYTSYPTAVQFSEKFRIPEYRAVVAASNQDAPPRQLSLSVRRLSDAGTVSCAITADRLELTAATGGEGRAEAACEAVVP